MLRPGIQRPAIFLCGKLNDKAASDFGALVCRHLYFFCTFTSLLMANANKLLL
jgi:hypothetical protein